MLVLTRRKGETLVAGEVVVTVLEITGNRVRLGFEAPAGCVILREEAKAREPKEETDEHDG